MFFAQCWGCFLHIPTVPFIHCKKESSGVFLLKGYIEERVLEIAQYIIDNNATVRQAAKHYGISKSTVHAVVTIWNEQRNGYGW